MIISSKPQDSEALPPVENEPATPFKDFWHQWGDKIVLVFLIIFFSNLAWWGFHHKDADLASFASDLAKQLTSSLMTLLVVAKYGPKPANGNGGTK